MANAHPPEAFDALEHVQKVWTGMRDRSPIYQMLLSDVEIFSAAKPGSITARLTVGAVHLNSKGTLHGTVSACLTDWAGGLAIAATGLGKSGVSTDIHISFVSTTREGDILEVNAQLVARWRSRRWRSKSWERTGHRVLYLQDHIQNM